MAFVLELARRLTADGFPLPQWEEMRKALPDVTWQNCDFMLSPLRLIKTARELGAMRAAGRLLKDLCDGARAFIRNGRKEYEVVADIDDNAAEVILVVHWMGGIHTEIRLPRRRRGQRNSTSPDIIAAVRLLARIANDDLIAGILNRNKLLTGHGNRWTP